MTPAQLAILADGEAIVRGAKPKPSGLPPLSDADDLAAFDGRL